MLKLDHYRAAWAARIDRDGLFQSLLEVVDDKGASSINALNFLALAWARSALGLHPDPSAGSARQVGAGEPAVDPLYAIYVVRFQEHLANFDTREVSSLLALDDGQAPFDLDPEDITRRLLALMPHAGIEIDIIQRVGKNLREVLARHMSFMDAVASNADTSMLETLYYGSPLTFLNNLMFAGVFEEVARVKGRPLKVLEIGAGTGGTTASISHLIPKHCSDYLFTDVSHVFLNVAKRRFKEGCLRYQILNIEDAAAFEALAHEKFDVVIAANALHVARSLPAALHNISLLLADGGCLLLSESDHKLPIWSEFIFGAAPDWWNAERDEQRSNGPLASQELWQSMIDAEIGDSFSALGREVLPTSNDHNIRQFPQIIVAVKRATAGTSEEAGDQAIELPAASACTLDVKRRTILVRTAKDAQEDRLQIRKFVPFDGEIVLELDEEGNLPNLVTGIEDQGVDFCVLLDHQGLSHDFLSGVPQGDPMLKEWFAVLSFLRRAMTRSDAGQVVSIVTVGAHPIGGEAPNMALSGYNGIYTTFDCEYPNSNLRSFDADSSLTPEEIAASIKRFLSRPYRRDQLAERNGRLLSPTLTRTSLIRRQENGAKPPKNPLHRGDGQEIPPFEIQVGRSRNFDDLSFVRQTSRPLERDEVEIDIHYVALNYRDVMKVQDEYPLDGGDYMNLGDECSGIVVAVGKDVDASLIGRRVMVVGEKLLASRAIVRAQQVLAIPDTVDLPEAASIPVAYLTAHYCLVTLAKIRRGERVLVHSGAGGVGLAAIRIAKAHGAEVYATASLPKQDIARHWGADHVYDSRSLDFERQIMQDTGGAGVDVVLNSLSGAYQAASMRLLGHLGRFVEIGKRDVYEHRAVNQYDLRRNISFHVVDMSRLPRSDQKQWCELLAEVATALENKQYLPLPFRIYRAAHVGQAFRTMATGRHVGKILMLMQDTAVEPLAKLSAAIPDYENMSLVITGGVSGLGLEIARYFASIGVGKLILSSRSEPASPVVADAISELSRYGCSQVSFVRCDVTDPADVHRLIVSARQGSPAALGVIHAAGVYEDRAIAKIDWESFRSVAAPKALGALNLHMATQGQQIDIFCLVSSISSVLGNAGQCSYAAANAFLDGLAGFRKSRGLVATAVNFGPFEDIGFLSDKPQVRSTISRTGTRFVPTNFGVKAIENAIAFGMTQVCVFDTDWRRWQAQMRFAEVPDRIKLVVSNAAAADEGTKKAQINILNEMGAAAPADRQKVVESYLCRRLAEVLNADASSIDLNLNLSSQGLDSLSTIELVISIEGDMKLNVSPEEFGQARTVKSIAKLLLQKYHALAEAA